MSGFKVIVSCSHCNEEMFAAELEPHLLSVISKQQAALDAVQRTHDNIAKMQDSPEYIASVALKLTVKSLREALAKADGGDA